MTTAGQLEFPRGWRQSLLGEVCQVVSGSTPKTSVDSYWGGDIPWITPNDLSKNRDKIVFGGERFITQAGYDSCSTQLVPAGSVLFTSRAPIGYVAIAGVSMCTNQGFKSAIPGPEVDGEFLYWQLQERTDSIRARASGTTFLEISGKGFAATSLVVPPLKEQAEIVRILEEQFSRLDAAAASIAAVRRKAARLRASFFKAALSGALSPPDEADAWELTSIGEIAEFGRKPPKDLLEANSEVSFVPMACVEEESGRIQLDQTIGAAEGKRRSLTYFEEGDVLFAKITPCMENGKVAIAKGLRNGAAFGSSEFYVLQTLESRVRPEFLNYVLVDPNFRGIAARAMTGAVGQQRVPRKFVEDFEILIPPLGSQDAIIAMLKSQFSRIDSALLASEAIQEKLLATRRSLLHAAFSGELTKEWREKNNG